MPHFTTRQPATCSNTLCTRRMQWQKKTDGKQHKIQLWKCEMKELEKKKNLQNNNSKTEI